MIRINLMPPEEKKESGQKIAVKLPTNLMNLLLAIPIIVTIAVVIMIHMKMEADIKRLTEEHAQKEQKHAELQKKIAVVNELQAQQQKLRSRLDTIAKLNSKRDYWENVFIDVAERLPEEFISLLSFSDVSDDERTQINVDGLALSDLQVSEYIANLRLSDFVNDVTLGGTRPDKYKGRDARYYNLQIYLVTPADSTQAAGTPAS